MIFVYSQWYIVMALLVAAIVSLIVVFIKMDKKDRVLISDFVKSMQENNEESKKPAVEETSNEENKE